MTRKLLFVDKLPNGWTLFGKTGWSGSMSKPDGTNELGWFVGWIEKGNNFFPFAYNIRESKVNLSQRIPRAKKRNSSKKNSRPKKVKPLKETSNVIKIY